MEEDNFTYIAKNCYNCAKYDMCFDNQLNEMEKFSQDNHLVFYKGLLMKRDKFVQAEEFETAKNVNNLATEIYLRFLG